MVKLKIKPNIKLYETNSEVEKSRPFLLHCPAFPRLRLKLLGSHNFGEPDELVGIDISMIQNSKLVTSKATFSGVPFGGFVITVTEIGPTYMYKNLRTDLIQKVVK